MSNYLTIDVGGTAIKYAVMDEEANIISQGETPTLYSDLDEYFSALDTVVLPHKDEVEGIAISMPGRIDNQTGYAYTSGALSFYEVPMGELLEERYQLPVAIENDGKCAANAELWKGNLKDAHSGVVIVLGTGIGGGIVLDHKVWRGFTGSASELSCLSTDYKHTGEYANFWAMSNGYIGLTIPYAKCKGLDMNEVNGKVFFKALNEGDEDAKNIFDQYLEMMVAGIYNVQVILDVEKMCIGGGISAQDILIEGIQNATHKFFAEKGQMLPVKEPKIDRCKFRNDANLIGALHNYFVVKG